MQNGLNTGTLREGLIRIENKLRECEKELNSLDGRLGDGDIGITMNTAFKLIRKELDSLPSDIGMALFKVAQGFTQSRGSSFGTLLATGIMSVAKSLKGKTEVAWPELPALHKALEEFRPRLCRQGRARIFGEKSRGCDDPGMVVIKRMLEGLARST
jgi:dihydroxyacetone kinase-like protein